MNPANKKALFLILCVKSTLIFNLVIEKNIVEATHKTGKRSSTSIIFKVVYNHITSTHAQASKSIALITRNKGKWRRYANTMGTFIPDISTSPDSSITVLAFY